MGDFVIDKNGRRIRQEFTQLGVGSRTIAEASISAIGELAVIQKSLIFADNFPGSSLDSSVWSQTLVGTGAVVVADTSVTLSATAASDAATIETVAEHSSLAAFPIHWGLIIITPDAGTTGNIREWGVYNDDDGYFFRLSGTTLSVVVRKGGSDTVVAASDFNVLPLTDPTSSVAVVYEIQYATTTFALFYVNRQLVHSARVTTGALVSAVQLKTRFRNNNVSATTKVDLICSVLSVRREGANFTFDASNHLNVVAPPPVAPATATAVVRIANGDVTGIADDVFAVPIGKTLTVQRLNAGAESAAGPGGKVEMFLDVTGDGSSLSILEKVFLNGSNSESTLADNVIGDGSRSIRMRRENLGGGTLEMFGRWDGFFE